MKRQNLYFHGSVNPNIRSIHKPSIDHPFCVTIDIAYALDYATQESDFDENASEKSGVVYAMNLNLSKLKIFDFGSKSNIELLSDSFSEYLINAMTPIGGARHAVDPVGVFSDFAIEYSSIKRLKKSEQREVQKTFDQLQKLHEQFFKKPIQKTHDDLVLDCRKLLLKTLQEKGFNGYLSNVYTTYSLLFKRYW